MAIDLDDFDSIWSAFAASIQRTGSQNLMALLEYPTTRAQLQAVMRTVIDKERRRRAPSLVPPELWAKKDRERANMEAMQLVAQMGEFYRYSAEQKRKLAMYSGWGGLSIEKYAGQFPKDLVPEERGLIHEYYTPSKVVNEVARVLAPLLPALPKSDGMLHVLEPSAGIGRFVNALTAVQGDTPIDWHVVEYSHVSAAMLQALRQDIDVFEGPFEAWVAQNEAEMSGKLGLVLANPPYGARGASFTQDPVRAYREGGAKSIAYRYFLRRGLDMLAPGGLGVYLVPAGFMTGTGAQVRAMRELILKRHHLTCAYRLPSGLFPGAELVTDLLFFRARGVELADVLAEDQSVLDGMYYKDNPSHILGQEVGGASDDEDQTKKPRWGYQVVGTFESLPGLAERPMLEGTGTAIKRSKKRRQGATNYVREIRGASSSMASDVAAAVNLGVRVDAYLAGIASNDAAAVQGWNELTRDLLSWVREHGNPWAHMGLSELDTGDNAAVQRFLSAFNKDSSLVVALTTEPKLRKRFAGRPDNVEHVVSALYRSEGDGVTFAEITRQISAMTNKSAAEVSALVQKQLPMLLESDAWCVSGPDLDRLVSAQDYYSGDLWDRYDLVQKYVQDSTLIPGLRGGLVHGLVPLTQLSRQSRKLLEAIKPAGIAEIVQDISPQQSWIPLEAVSAWASQVGHYPRAVTFTRDPKTGLLQSSLGSWEPFCGWANHDDKQFEVRRQKGKKAHEIRDVLRQEWTTQFRAWLPNSPYAQLVEDVYNRTFRGFVAPTFSMEPLPIARWNTDAVQLFPHQAAGARRILHNRRGLLAFDVGVGKTYTGIAIMARARQDGWAQRPVIVVPNTIVWKWKRDIERALPDYRVGVVGAKQTEDRKGVKRSRLDTPEERAQTWSEFQVGLFDVVVCTYTALPRTQINEKAIRDYAAKTPAISRVVELEQKRLKEQNKELTERQAAILKEGVVAWIAERIELPEGQVHDPGIAWDDIGIDMIIVDEAQNFKNLYMPEARDGSVPKYMGAGGSGSKRAWQLDFRCAAVRRRTGGSGVVLLSATPAKNSPLEFYNLIQFVDHDVWVDRGILDPEHFTDRYLQIEVVETTSSKFEIEQKPAVVGFQNLPELRDILFRYAEFKTAEDVGLTIPSVQANMLHIRMDARQEAKYDRYVKEIEESLENPREEAGKVLGLLVKLAMIAIHAELDEGPESTDDEPKGWTWKDADKVSNPMSPKFKELARRVLATKDSNCGHIVFVENVAAHKWITEVLVKAGISRKRIAILNAKSAQAPQKRQQIADDFNGAPTDQLDADGEMIRAKPKYDVVIANSVAYEGIDLQTRTCAIHHLDLPWEPATLQQRNGRGVRQGNKFKSIEINYYMSRRSTDGLRFAMINGKHGWMTALLKSQDRDTNNPAAQADLTPEDVLLMISRDPEKTKAKLRDAQRRRTIKRRAKAARHAGRMLAMAVGNLVRAARTSDADKAAALRADAEERFRFLRGVAADDWPYAGVLSFARENPDMVDVTMSGIPLISGTYLRYFDKSVAEVGRSRSFKFGLRNLGSTYWSETNHVVLDGRIERNAEDAIVAVKELDPPLSDEPYVDTGPEVIPLSGADTSNGSSNRSELDEDQPLPQYMPEILWEPPADLLDKTPDSMNEYDVSPSLLKWASERWIDSLYRKFPTKFLNALRPAYYDSVKKRPIPTFQDGLATVAMLEAYTHTETLAPRVPAPTIAGFEAYLRAFAKTPPDDVKHGEAQDACKNWFGEWAVIPAGLRDPKKAHTSVADFKDIARIENPRRRPLRRRG